jgi:hypothetical protein
MRDCVKKLGLVDLDQTYWPDHSCFYCFHGSPFQRLAGTGGA